jgi:hypothetical protein
LPEEASPEPDPKYQFEDAEEVMIATSSVLKAFLNSLRRTGKHAELSQQLMKIVISGTIHNPLTHTTKGE